MTTRERVPLTILAGFLGSGKTTLLNRILAGDHGLRVAVLVNDFGSIDVDARLVVARDAQTISLDNGCVCCSVSADLVSQLVLLLEGPDAPEHLVVETSGVSDPGRLLVALRDPHLRRLARIDGVVTLVDAAGIDEIPLAHLELARRQLASADVIVVNKVDLVDREQVSDLCRRLTASGARVVEAVEADVPLDVVLGLDRVDGGSAAADPGSGTAHAHVSTWSWTCSSPLAYASLRDVLTSLPAPVYRAKGFVHLAEAPAERVVAHVVGRRVDLRPLDRWGERAPLTELVFVALSASLDGDELRRRLEATVASDERAGLALPAA